MDSFSAKIDKNLMIFVMSSLDDVTNFFVMSSRDDIRKFNENQLKFNEKCQKLHQFLAKIEFLAELSIYLLKQQLLLKIYQFEKKDQHPARRGALFRFFFKIFPLMSIFLAL